MYVSGGVEKGVWRDSGCGRPSAVVVAACNLLTGAGRGERNNGTRSDELGCTFTH